MRRHARLLTTLLLLGASLSAQDGQDIRIAPVAIGQSTILVSAPGGGSPDAETANRLGQRVTLVWQETSLQEAVDFLQRTTNLNLIIDPAVVDTAPLITFRAEDMRVGTVIEWLERLTGLTVSYIHEAIYISDRVVRGERDTRLYDVSALTMGIPNFSGPDLAFNASEGAGGGTGFKLFQNAGAADGDYAQSYDIEDLAEILRRHVGAE